MNVIETKQLSKIYKNNKVEVQALAEVNLEVENGSFVAIMGPSGSGKSTLLHLLGGLEKPTLGDIIVGGKSIITFKEKELAEYRRTQIGFVFQQYNLIPILNVKENIVLPLAIEKDCIDMEYFNRLVDFLGLTDKKKHLPGELSGGQQQRVALARALITKPEIILADEPTGNLDRKTSLDVLELLSKCNKEFGQTVLMITHDMQLAQKADIIYQMIDGRITNE